MIDLSKIEDFQKASKASFQQQRMMIKKLMLGQQVLCSHCQQVLQLNLPENNALSGNLSKSKRSNVTNKKGSSISCAKGCTDIELDFVL